MKKHDNEYTFKKPRTNTTGNQLRKHKNHMTKGEKIRCSKIVKEGLNRKGIRLSNHVIERGVTVNILSVVETILSDILWEEVIEYNERKMNNNLWSQRVLFNIPMEQEFFCSRTNKILKGELKVVYEVTTGYIVTAYYNEIGDDHKTLNYSNYDRKLLIRDYVNDGYVFKNKGVK